MRRLALICATLTILVGLAACDDRECLEGHNVPSTTVVFTGKTTIPVVTTTYVCDKYAPTEEEVTQ